jgi:hypothetical protein
MTPERFNILAQAYGADLRRWPENERASARQWADANEALAAAALAQAAALDGLLAGYTLAPPAPALSRRIVAAMPGSQKLWRQARLWWSGVGLAGAGLAGLAAGALVASILITNAAPASPADVAYAATAFSNEGADGSSE